ncbi:MAG: hypothetical protein PHY48_04250 [Candidatus Cloacimonetes bacterium]|nr:hypothetical protein [Candidatus Cloacimonadota bacterium]
MLTAYVSVLHLPHSSKGESGSSSIMVSKKEEGEFDRNHALAIIFGIAEEYPA